MTTNADGSEKKPGTTLDAGSGNSGGGNGDGGQGQGTGTVDPFAGLEAGTLEWLGKKGVKGPEGVAALAKMAQNSEALIGSMVKVPSAEATPEERNAFYERIGRPKTAAEYDFAPPANMPENVPYDKGFADWYRNAAHKAGVPAAMAKTLHDEFVTATVQSAVEAQTKLASEGTTALEKAWNHKVGTDGYKANVSTMTKGVQALGGQPLIDAFKAHGLLGPSGEILVPVIAEAMFKAGKTFGTEDGHVQNEGGTPGENPFAKETYNLTKASQLVKLNPAKARTLISQAGRKPAEFGLA